MSVPQPNMEKNVPESMRMRKSFFGRMDQRQMAEMIKEKQIDLVIDATHPFAQLVTGEIRRPAKSPVCSICVACGRRWSSAG